MWTSQKLNKFQVRLIQKETKTNTFIIIFLLKDKQSWKQQERRKSTPLNHITLLPEGGVLLGPHKDISYTGNYTTYLTLRNKHRDLGKMKQQRNMFQMKEQDKSTGVQLWSGDKQSIQ